jgi:mannose-6-phosphate isomerase-like protein (cupin superfamily)
MDMTDAPLTDRRNDQFFDRLNLDEVPLSEAQVCGGEGLMRFGFLCHEGQSSGSCRLIALVEIPPGSSLGRHLHQPDEEEFCLVLNGQGVMWRNGEEFPVRAGDLIRNPPSGEHGFQSLGPDTLRIFVFQVSVNP